MSILECCRRLSVQGVGSYEALLKLSRRVELPWCGVKEGCEGLLYNGGLYTQCGKEVVGVSYCVECMGRKEEGRWNGDVSERMKCKIGEYRVGARREVSYVKWLSKNGVSREMAEREALSIGVRIPPEHFLERESRRGRPRKECKEVSNDWKEESNDSKEDWKEESKEESNDSKEESKEEWKEESNDSKEEWKEVVEPVKKKRGRPRKEKSMSSNNESEDLIASLLKERKESELEKVVNDAWSEKESSSDAEEETLVIKIEIDGKTYLKSEDNTVFDFMSHDELGRWNEKEQKIVLG